MGLYATTTSLDLLMVGVNFSATDQTTLASALIDRAERRINTMLARRYDLSTAPFQTTTSIPPLVREWAAQMAEGYVWQHLARGGAGKESMERGKAMIKEVMDDLALLTGYKLDLVNTAGSIITDMSNTAYRVMCNTKDYTPTFDEDDELNWAQDEDKLEDIEDSRD